MTNLKFWYAYNLNIQKYFWPNKENSMLFWKICVKLLVFPGQWNLDTLMRHALATRSVSSDALEFLTGTWNKACCFEAKIIISDFPCQIWNSELWRYILNKDRLLYVLKNLRMKIRNQNLTPDPKVEVNTNYKLSRLLR